MRMIAVLVALALGVIACGGSDDPPKPEPLAANALYVFAIKSAQIAALNGDINWDTLDGPDVFAAFSDGVNVVNSSYIDNSFTPTWATPSGANVTVGVMRSGNFSVQLFDYDGVSANDPITNPWLITLTDAQIRAGTVTFTNWNYANSVTFVIAPAP